MRLTILTFVAFVGGFALGAWLWAKPDGADTPRAGDEPERSAVATRSAEVSSARAASGPPTVPPESVVPVRHDLVAAIAEFAEPVEVAPGAGQICGVVSMQDNGEPVAGVQVRATAIPRGTNAYGESLDDPREWLRNVLIAQYERHDFELAHHATTTSRGDGTYCLDALSPEITYLVEAYLPSARIRTAHGSSSRVLPGANVDFEVTGLATIHVSLESNAEIVSEHVRLLFRELAREETHGFDIPTAGGQVTLEPGRYELTATVDSPHLKSDPVTLELAFGAPHSEVLALEPRAGIHGRVLLPDVYATDARVFVHAHPLGEGEAPETIGRFEHEVRADRENDLEFALLDLAPGSYVIATELQGQRAEREVVVEPGSMTRADLEIPESPRESYAIVWVRNPRGDLVEARSVRPWCVIGPRSQSQDRGTRLEDGSWLVPHPDTEDFLRRGGTPPGPLDLRLQIYLRHGREAWVSYTAEPATVVNAIVQDAGMLEVYLAGAVRDRYRPMLRRVKLEGTAAPHTTVKETGTLDRDGRVRFEHLDPGRYAVTLHAEPPGSRAPGEPVQLVRKEIEVTSGSQTIPLQVPPLHRVEVSHPGVEHVRLEVPSYRIHPSLHPQSGEESTVFDPVPAGAYRLLGGGGVVRLDVHGDMSLILDPMPYDALFVRLRDPAGHAGQSGLRDGDVIVAVGGQVAESTRALRGLLRASAPGGTVTVTVRRAGAEHDIQVNPALLLDPNLSGCQLAAGSSKE